MEELIHDGHGHPPRDERQAALIARYCAEAAERVEKASDRDEAKRIIADSCARFESDCQSTILRRQLRRFADELLQQRWGES